MAPTLLMRRLPSILAFTLPALASVPTASSEPLPTAILSNEGVSSRTLVGDWEPPDLVVLAYSDGWPETTHTLLDAVSAVQPVVLLSEAGDALPAQASIDALHPEQRPRVWLSDHEIDSSWARDYGPLQTRSNDGEVLWLDALYSVDRPRDDDLPLALAMWFGTVTEPVFETLEGGALASNGRGLCVSTAEYFETNGIELAQDSGAALLEQLGCQTMALVPALAHENTKHIDLLLQFLAPDLAIVARFDPTDDLEDARRTDAAVAVLRQAAASMGQPLTIERIDSPGASGGYYRSYVNVLQLADHLLVPSYDTVDPDVEDAALSALGRLVPEHTVVRIPAEDASASGGSVHCLTWGLHLP